MRLTWITLAAALLLGACAGSQNAKPSTGASAMTAPTAFDSAPAIGTKATCPVTGKVFTVTADSKRAEHDGKHYVFCCTGCKNKFEADPEKFLGKKHVSTTPAADDSGVPMAFDTPPAVGSKARCPVSGKAFTINGDTPRSVHDGKHYAFCCKGCKPKFDADPAKFLNKKHHM